MTKLEAIEYLLNNFKYRNEWDCVSLCRMLWYIRKLDKTKTPYTKELLDSMIAKQHKF